MEFKEELKKYQNSIELELKKYIRTQNVPESKLNESMEYSLISGGKRLRPILIIATYQLFKQKYDICLP